MGVICAGCGRENREGRRFCDGCGAPLPARCPRCGASDPGERFCGECGAPLRTATPAAPREPEGERKQLTVLFADVQGSMELQEDLDVETWARIVDRFVDILAGSVHLYGGTVDKFTGDGIMALFGAPVALEDHARRACHAAWHMTRAIRDYAEDLRRSEGVDLQVRVGLNSGEAVVGRVGEDVRVDPTALGRTVGLAQRMEALATPGSAYLTEHTARLVQGWFRLRDLGPMVVKGVRDPLGVHVLEGPAPPRARAIRASTRLVGRAAELARLEEALARAAEGDAQVVGIAGVPGVGKSRLCDEFARSALARGVTVRTGGGVSHGRDVPLLPVLALLREYFGISDADSPAQARERVRDRLAGLELLEDLPLLLDFLEIPEPEQARPQVAGEIRMRRLFEVLRRITTRRSERELLVLVIEDLHWFDAQSTTFLERLVEGFHGSRTLVVTNFRPEFRVPWAELPSYREIVLSPLSIEAVAELLTDLLGDDPSLEPLPAYLMERTGGNPFFVEEVVRALVEDGTLTGEQRAYRLSRSPDRAALPARVQAVLAARIDRLSSDQKRVLESAAVVGRNFAPAVLARVVGTSGPEVADSISALCAVELLQQAHRPPVSEYRFWHALTQEVAYGSMLSARRARLHATVAEALIEHHADRLDEVAGVIAWHWERAGRRLDAARWSMRAAQFAVRTDVVTAVARWRAAIDHLGHVDETEESLELGIRARQWVLRYAARLDPDSSELERVEDEGRRMAERRGDPTLAAGMLHACATRRIMAAQLPAARDLYTEAAALADAAGDGEMAACARYPVAFINVHLGHLEVGLRVADDMVDVCRHDPSTGLRILGFEILGLLLANRTEGQAHMGRLVTAASECERLLQFARERARPEELCFALRIPPLVSWITGDGADTTADGKEAVRLAEETGNVIFLVTALWGLILSQLGRERPADALVACEKALQMQRRSHYETLILSHLATCRLALDEAGAARAAAEDAVSKSRDRGVRLHECIALLTRARVGRALGEDPSDVLGDLGLAMALSHETGAAAYEPQIREEMGRVRADEAMLREAVRLYQAIGASGHARRLESELRPRPM